MTPCSSGNSPTMLVSRSALARPAAVQQLVGCHIGVEGIRRRPPPAHRLEPPCPPANRARGGIRGAPDPARGPARVCFRSSAKKNPASARRAPMTHSLPWRIRPSGSSLRSMTADESISQTVVAVFEDQALLVVAEGRDDDLRRQLEESLFEGPRDQPRPLDQLHVLGHELGIRMDPGAGLRWPGFLPDLRAVAGVGQDPRPRRARSWLRRSRRPTRARKAPASGPGGPRSIGPPRHQRAHTEPPRCRAAPPPRAPDARKCGIPSPHRIILGKRRAATTVGTISARISEVSRPLWTTVAVRYSPLSVSTRPTSSNGRPTLRANPSPAGVGSPSLSTATLQRRTGQLLAYDRPVDRAGSPPRPTADAMSREA